MRGIFSVGVLDVLLERGFEPFDLAIGVSAGACNLASHVARQEGRNRRCYFELMSRREFIDLRRALRGGSIVDLDWLWERLAATEPLDAAGIVARAAHPEKRVELVVVATSLASGDPVYLRPGADVMSDALKASCALPGLYRGEVVLGGEALVDGGVSDPIPVEEAYRLGARRIFVVRSRPAAFVKTNGWSSRLTPLLWRSRPVLARAMLRTAERYQRAVAFLQQPPADCQVVEVAPPQALATRRMTQDRAALERDYALGRRMGQEAIARWVRANVVEEEARR